MGYRHRIGKVKKSEYKKYKEMTEEQILAEIGEDESVYYPPFHKQLYELGKYCSFSGTTKIPFYSFELPDTEFWIIDKPFLKEIINDQRKSVAEYYSDLKSLADSIGNGVALTEKQMKFVQAQLMPTANSRLSEWSGKFGISPYWLDEKCTDGRLVRSWAYEYSIFNLVDIYQSFDWENDLMILSAW